MYICSDNLVVAFLPTENEIDGDFKLRLASIDD